jgi:hypothetical protein
MPQQVRGIPLHHDFRFKVQPSGEAEILMERPGVTVGTAVFAPAVRIQAVSKANVGAVVLGDDRAALVVKKLSPRIRRIGIESVGIVLVVKRDETVGRVESRSSSSNRLGHTDLLNAGIFACVPRPETTVFVSNAGASLPLFLLLFLAFLGTFLGTLAVSSSHFVFLQDR